MDSGEQVDIPALEDAERSDFASILNSLHLALQSAAGSGEATRRGGRTAASLTEVHPSSAVSLSELAVGEESVSEGLEPPQTVRTPGLEVDAFSVGDAPSASFEDSFKVFFSSTKERYLDWLASLPEDEWSRSDPNSTKDDMEGVDEDEEELLEQNSKESAMEELRALYDAFDAIDELKSLRMPSEIMKDFEDMAPTQSATDSGKLLQVEKTQAPSHRRIPQSLQDPIRKFTGLLHGEKKKFFAAQKSVQSLKGLMVMDKYLKPYTKCLQTIQEKEYRPDTIRALYTKMMNNETDGKLNFKMMFKALWEKKYMTKAFTADMNRVLMSLTTTHFDRVKSIVDGSVDVFTVSNLRTPTWIEGVADHVHALYKKLITQRGLGPLKCADDELLKDAYKDLKPLLITIGKHHMKQLKTYWDKLMPQAMRWIRIDLLNFFTQKAPQVGVIVRALSRRVAKKCFDMYHSKNTNLKAYLRVRAKYKAKRPEYDKVLEKLQATFIPHLEVKAGKDEEKDVLLSSQLRSAANEVVVQSNTAMENILTKATRKWLLEFQSLVQSTVVEPVFGQTASLLRSIGLSIHYAVQGMFGLIPYVGGAIFNLVGQMLQACENFVVGKLEDLGVLSVASLFKAIDGQLPLLSKMVVKDYSAKEKMLKKGPPNLGGNGINKGVRSSDAAAPSAMAQAVTNAVYSGLTSAELKKDLQPLKTVVAVVVNLAKEAFPSIKSGLVNCDLMAPTMAATFVPAKPV